MNQQTVFFQGEQGSFSEQAARKYFGRYVHALPKPVFAEVFRSVEQSRGAFGIVPIENSVFGSIHQNYDLLLKHNLVIVGETQLRIELNLAALPGTKLKDVKQIYSQPQALGQCETFLGSLKNVKVIAFHDTAAAARMIREENRKDSAAIASGAAVRQHGLRILQRNVESDHENFTRFLVLSKKQIRIKGRAKTSLTFAVKDTPGALFKALAVFTLRDINLLKIESRPFIGRPWQYLFYVDIDGALHDEKIQRALRHLQEVCSFVRVFGSYAGVVRKTS
ncbi:MAG TPA: prephenate dehydratase [Bacteroidota bacterium]|nr:prephenate dehydratase [Bacteroidota bacterium]